MRLSGKMAPCWIPCSMLCYGASHALRRLDLALLVEQQGIELIRAESQAFALMPPLLNELMSLRCSTQCPGTKLLWCLAIDAQIFVLVFDVSDQDWRVESSKERQSGSPYIPSQ